MGKVKDESITRCAGCGGWVHVKHTCGTCNVIAKK